MKQNTWRAYGRVILHAAEMALRTNLTDSFVLFGVLVQPIIIALMAFWMLGDKGGDIIIFMVIGSGMTGLWTTCLFVSGHAITEERWTGTLELIVSTPTPVAIIVIGKVLANVLMSLASIVLSYMLAILIFGYAPTIEQPLWFVTSIAVAILAYASFGILISPFFMLNPEIRRLQNGLEFPVYILSGFMFPIALLPFWTTPLSYLLSPYWAARALHAASSQWNGVGEMALSWGMMVGLSVIYLAVASVLFRRVLYRARVDATLGMQ
jgi:ABC-2 type transport system permease protein